MCLNHEVFFFFFFFFSNIAKDKNSWALERMGGLACSINNLGSTKKKSSYSVLHL